jgi:hypothetical protein
MTFSRWISRRLTIPREQHDLAWLARWIAGE